jgi:hypothetical protein
VASKAGRYKIDYDRLVRAIRHGRKALEFPRRQRRRAIELLAGPRWSEESAQQPSQPVNLLNVYVQTMIRALVAKEPRVLYTTDDLSQTAAVAAMQEWANRQAKKMRLADVLQRAVYDALIGVGVVKVGLAGPGHAAASGWAVQAGSAFAETVSLDDLVYDAHARRFDAAGFVGHRYRMHRDVALELYGRRAKDLPVSTHPHHNEDGDERAEALGRGYYGMDAEEYCEHVDLFEVYVPKYRRVVTVACEEDGSPSLDDDKPLDDVEWFGPDRGPYHFLAYGWVPDNAMPNPPALHLIDIHEAANNQFRKLLRQAERQKELLLVQGQASEDGQTIVGANDGEAHKVENPDAAKVYKFGGADPALFAFFTATKEMFNWLAGNLDLQGGLSPQSKTASQDRMLNENASANTASMQATTVEFAACVCDSLGWWGWHHPDAEMKARFELDGAPEVQTVRRLYPRNARDPMGNPRALRRQAKWDEMDVRVDPYSMGHKSPEQRAAMLDQMVTQVVAPMMGLLQQQGVVFDAHEWASIVSEYRDMPEVRRILSIQAPPAGGPGGSSGGAAAEGAGMPAATNRTYTRENVSSRSQQGQDMALAEAMAGIDLGGDPNGGG